MLGLYSRCWSICTRCRLDFDGIFWLDGQGKERENPQICHQWGSYPRLHRQPTQEDPWNWIQEEGTQGHQGDPQIRWERHGNSRCPYRDEIEQAHLVPRSQVNTIHVRSLDSGLLTCWLIAGVCHSVSAFVCHVAVTRMRIHPTSSTPSSPSSPLPPSRDCKLKTRRFRKIKKKWVNLNCLWVLK